MYYVYNDLLVSYIDISIIISCLSQIGKLRSQADEQEASLKAQVDKK